MKKFVCKHPWSHFEVNNPNGDVTMCCNNGTVLGNVNKNTVAEIWNGDAFQGARKVMRDEGAYAMCPHTCPVLQGGKKYENLDWFKTLDKDGEPRRNAECNEREFAAGETVLQSVPRWLRFTYSYACNLDCYHCYQREDAKMRVKLPDSFMRALPEYARTSQVVFPFGGEPFYFKPVLDFLNDHDANLETRFFFITNATLLTDRVHEILRRVPINCMATSLDAATEASFEALRVRGRNAKWSTAMENMKRLQKLKAEKNFTFTVSMTVNSVNAGEVEQFVDLALSFDAEPLISLVANPYQTYAFQKQYLLFTEVQFDDMLAAIERSLPKVIARGFDDAEVFLKQLRAAIRQHRARKNDLAGLKARNLARKVFWSLPEQLQLPIRKVVQRVRIRDLEKHSADDKG